MKLCSPPIVQLGPSFPLFSQNGMPESCPIERKREGGSRPLALNERLYWNNYDSLDFNKLANKLAPIFVRGETYRNRAACWILLSLGTCFPLFSRVAGRRKVLGMRWRCFRGGGAPLVPRLLPALPPDPCEEDEDEGHVGVEGWPAKEEA